MTRPIRVILDASAIMAFSREKDAIHVGEVLAEVADEEGAAFGLPMLCLIEAAPAVADPDRLELLLANPACMILTPGAWAWRALVATRETVGRIDAATAVLAAVEHDCDILTAQRALYAGLAGGGPIIPI